VRIVSLLPGATEMLCALGLGPQLVGVTHGCDYPTEITGLPRVTGCSIPKDATGGEVDRLVRERYRAGLPLYDLDLPLLQRLAPDLLVTQGLCDVCALPDTTVREAACALPRAPRVVSLAPATLAEVFANLDELGVATGREAEARRLRSALETRVERIAAVTRAVAARPRVSLLEWVDPLYACGHWTPELVSLAGGEEGHGRPGARSRTMSWSEVREWNPEVLVLAACGLDAASASAQLAGLGELPGFADLACVAGDRMFAVDGAAYFSRPGPRLVESLELLAHLLHPAQFPEAPVPSLRMRWSRRGLETTAA